jgi:hypothetical protein
MSIAQSGTEDKKTEDKKTHANDSTRDSTRPKRVKQLIAFVHNLEPGNRIKAFCLKGRKFTFEFIPYYPLCTEKQAKIEVNLQNSIVERGFAAASGSDWILRLVLSDGQDLVFKFPMETKVKYYLA